MPSPAPLLQVEAVSKRFPGVKALDGVSMEVFPGEVVALIGENGAGKSTLMKILAGVQPPDEGRLLVDGAPVVLDSVRTAQAHGIALIHQELNLADNLDVGANIFLGREPTKWGMIDRRAIEEGAKKALAAVGLDVSPHTLVKSLSIGRQQLVEIAKALAVDARLLIMDEPTSSLSQHETEVLFRLVKDLRRRGISVVYISHRLGEVRELADRVVAFRDGKNAGSLARDEITEDRMVSMMVGRDASGRFQRSDASHGAVSRKVRLAVRGLVTDAHPEHAVSFEVREGEIVGMAGLVGAGRTEVLETLFGVRPALAGEVEVDGAKVAIRHPWDAVDAGLALVPEDRKQQGLVLEFSVEQNITLARLWRDLLPGWMLNFGEERKQGLAMIERLRIKTASPQKPIQFLSGGNQQKGAIARWLLTHPKVLFLDEPTRGVDVGAKEEIYRIMEETAAQGMAVLFVSSDLQEVLALSDRVLVMHEGRITAELPRERLSEETVMAAATGQPLAERAVAAV